MSASIKSVPNRFKFWLSYFTPQNLETATSAQNGSILVRLTHGRPEILVAGAIQAGGIASRRINLTIERFSQLNPQLNPTTLLILGYGVGQAGYFFHRHYPRLKITGIDYDPLLVELGRQYFPQAPQIKISIADVFNWIEQPAPSRYDLIYLDLYHGFTIPPALSDIHFLKQVKKLLNPNGMVIINYFADIYHPNHLSKLRQSLSQTFVHVSQVPILYNQIFFLS